MISEYSNCYCNFYSSAVQSQILSILSCRTIISTARKLELNQRLCYILLDSLKETCSRLVNVSSSQKRCNLAQQSGICTLKSDRQFKSGIWHYLCICSKIIFDFYFSQTENYKNSIIYLCTF
ncbi:Hypothetical_protein [Hexamita inflata]|nr:Hypothetical protein HINF_LOCUS50006 [Hexamita inflata]